MSHPPQFSVSDLSLDDARRFVAGASCWVITDGKTGDVVQCLGVAERLGLVPLSKTVNPRAFFTWFMPYGPVDPLDSPTKTGSPMGPPYPDIAIASGRRALPSLRAIRKASGGRTFTVFLKDPRTGAGSADFIWVPTHDSLRGPNVLVTLTSPHRISIEGLEEARRKPTFQLKGEGHVIGVLLGGNSQHHRYPEASIHRLTDHLRELAAQGLRLAVTPSGRTPPELAEAVRKICLSGDHFYWDGTGTNPYLSILATADHLVVTADSVNMLGEAASTGKPIHLFTPEGGHTKMSAFAQGMIDHGAVRPLVVPLETWSYPPLDSTPTIAVAVAAAYARRKI